MIPLLDTTLLTNAAGEPNLWNQPRSEMDSADRIDVIRAFIRHFPDKIGGEIRLLSAISGLTAAYEAGDAGHRMPTPRASGTTLRSRTGSTPSRSSSATGRRLGGAEVIYEPDYPRVATPVSVQIEVELLRSTGRQQCRVWGALQILGLDLGVPTWGGTNDHERPTAAATATHSATAA